jgi:hypothetical protein
MASIVDKVPKRSPSRPAQAKSSGSWLQTASRYSALLARVQTAARAAESNLNEYAKAHGLPFMDIAGKTPFDPGLFLDAVHTSYAGSRVRGWITFNELVQVVRSPRTAGAPGSWEIPLMPMALTKSSTERVEMPWM